MPASQTSGTVVPKRSFMGTKANGWVGGKRTGGEPLYQQVRAACPREADGVLIAGTGFRCVGILDALERDLQRPVVSANQASLWHCLRLAGVRTPVGGYGNLFSL
jgi:maleate cis-trans isomerase